MNVVVAMDELRLGNGMLAPIRAVLLTGIAMLLLSEIAACTSTGSASNAPEYLDPQTAATITVVEKPLVLARERPELAANVRDYVTLSAFAVNRSGKVSCYWVAYFWSTLDARSTAAIDTPEQRTPVLLIEDRRIAFGSRISLQQAGVGIELHRPPGVVTEPTVYPVALETLRFVAASREIKLLASSDPTELPYSVWKNERGALSQLVKQLSVR